jgi:hypothetical protein
MLFLLIKCTRINTVHFTAMAYFCGFSAGLEGAAVF